ncbi:Diutan polysaccharide export protein [Sphingobium yanoikuyae]|jgi:Mrp family chromosome partitioning ATPase|uniref:Diutan polysaccharide export protein n=1 Tax=Sphingobium yanoikuyae TaxID=13690 RepID=A0A084EBG2_SPHYA|nr:CpsD/CapB family tyrosine-protein kinase [Sphingobium yanoikuyae]KEZ15304.1 Diutan polysaccharide export protein [Sphingobium yanoikuyae]
MSDIAEPTSLSTGDNTPEPATTETAAYRFSRRIISLSKPDSPEAKSIRSLHTHLLSGHVRDGRRGLAICSPTVGAGCTTVAVNLATVFAQAGTNTLLVDANLVAPAIDEYIRPEMPALGLRQMLTAGSDIRTDLIRRDVMPNLSVLYAGGGGRGASELIANRYFKELIDDCMRDFEFTIIDTPAQGGWADARRVAMSVRYGMIVARRHRSYLSEIKAFAEELSADRVQLIGSFLTDF